MSLVLDMRNRRYSVVRRAGITWAPLVMLSLLIFWFSHQPGFGQPHLFLRMALTAFGEYGWYRYLNEAVRMIDAVASDAAHFVEYALLALASLWAVARQWPYYPRKYLLAFVYPAYFAVTDELHQYFIPGRHCSMRDVLTDWTGAAFVLAATFVILRTKENQGPV